MRPHDASPLAGPDVDLVSPLDAPPVPACRTVPDADEWDDEEELSQPSLAIDAGLWHHVGPRPLPPWTRAARTEANGAAVHAALRASVRPPPPKPAPDPSVIRGWLRRLGWG